MGFTNNVMGLIGDTLFNILTPVNPDSIERTGEVAAPRQELFRTYGDTNIDFLSATPPDYNSAVMACATHIANGFFEGEIKLWNNSAEEYVDSHPVLDFLQEPSPYYGLKDILNAYIIDLLTNGRSFIIKERNDSFNITGMVWAPSHTMKPLKYQLGKGWIKAWRYEHQSYQGKTFSRYGNEDLIQSVYALDTRTGIGARSPIDAAAVDAYTDQNVRLHLAQLLNNKLDLDVMFKSQGQHINDSDAKSLSEALYKQIGGDRRGRPIFLNGIEPVRMDLSPRELQMRETAKMPEERIAANYRVPPMVAMLGSGLDASTYNNYHEARQIAFEYAVAPIAYKIIDDLNTQLLWAEFDDARRFMFIYDKSNVPSLKENEDSRQERIRQNYLANLITREEAREQLGYDPAPAQGSFQEDTDG